MHAHGSFLGWSIVSLKIYIFWTFSNILGDKSRLLTLRSQCWCMRRIELNTYSKLHFIQKYVLCFTDRVCFVIIHQLVQRRKLSDPQVVLFLLIFEDLKVLHLVAAPIKVIRVENKSLCCFNLLFFRGRNPASKGPSIFLDKTYRRALHSQGKRRLDGDVTLGCLGVWGIFNWHLSLTDNWPGPTTPTLIILTSM